MMKRRANRQISGCEQLCEPIYWHWDFTPLVFCEARRTRKMTHRKRSK